MAKSKAKTFKAPVSQDFEIMEGDQVFGTLRVRPSGILWAPKNSHVWYRLSMEDLGAHAVAAGTQTEK